MLRVSIRTTGRTWLIRPGELAFINTMVTPLTGKKELELSCTNTSEGSPRLYYAGQERNVCWACSRHVGRTAVPIILALSDARSRSPERLFLLPVLNVPFK